MQLFTAIEGAQAVIYQKPGFYRQVPLYERGGLLYAKAGAGFVKVYTDGRTSHPNVRCDPDNIDLGEDGYRLEAKLHLWQVIPPVEAAAAEVA